MKADHVVIAGGSGFLGVNLAKALSAKKYQVTLLVRTPPKEKGDWHIKVWNGYELGDWVSCLEGATALVNLAGRSVNCVKTPDHCDEILRSRVDSTRVLGQALRQLQNPPQIWVQMSTAHIYGDPPSQWCCEESSLGYGLAPEVGKAWETAFAEAVLPSMRPVILRTSFVLGMKGGAFPLLSLLARIGLGGRVGSGRQGVSWIHESDLNALFLRAIEWPEMQGVYLATAPDPVSYHDFMIKIRQQIKMPIGLPATAWMLKIVAQFLFNTDPELVLYGRYCYSKKLKDEEFVFQYAKLDDALKALLKK
jgi:hypothetical protein